MQAAWGGGGETKYLPLPPSPAASAPKKPLTGAKSENASSVGKKVRLFRPPPPFRESPDRLRGRRRPHPVLFFQTAALLVKVYALLPPNSPPAGLTTFFLAKKLQKRRRHPLFPPTPASCVRACVVGRPRRGLLLLLQGCVKWVRCPLASSFMQRRRGEISASGRGMLRPQTAEGMGTAGVGGVCAVGYVRYALLTGPRLDGIDFFQHRTDTCSSACSSNERPRNSYRACIMPQGRGECTCQGRRTLQQACCLDLMKKYVFRTLVYAGQRGWMAV